MWSHTEWTEELSVGNSLIDAQHQSLLKLGRLARDLAENPNASRESLHAVLNNIATESIRHFDDEERIMAANGCPTLAEHREAHAALLEELAEFLFQASEKATAFDKQWLADFVNKLVVGHVLTMDVPNKAFMGERHLR